MPRFAGDSLPSTGAGLALAIGDKLDTLVSIFAIGQKPTGTKDPYGLRRSALGVLRILIETGIALDLRELIRSALESATADIARLGGKAPADGLADEIYDYMMERLRAWYLEAGRGVTTEMFDAVLDTRPASPLDFDHRLQALAAFLQHPDAPGSRQPTSGSPTSSGRPASSRVRASIRACSRMPRSASSRPRSRRCGRTSSGSSPRAATRKR